MENVREIRVFDVDTKAESGVKVSKPTRKIVACAVLTNPYAHSKAASKKEIDHLAEISYDVGVVLVKRALAMFRPDEKVISYGKAALVGLAGQREHGAAMIHLKVGLAMRSQLRYGPALIPGNEKLGAAGSSIDLVFGGTQTGWEYDSFDSVEITIPGAPNDNEIVLAIGFAAGGRPNARIEGVDAETVSKFLKTLKSPAAAK